MPVFARLSRRFYDVVGEDVTQQLVDWINAVEQEVSDRAPLRASLVSAPEKVAGRQLVTNRYLRERNDFEVARSDAELTRRMSELRVDLRKEIAGLRTELLGWMFVFWITNFVGIAGLLIALRGH
jgi:hypothetical protein